MRLAAAPLVALGALAATARADTRVDWAAGRVTATGVGLADRHAPNPAVARGPARRKADDAAKARLARALPALPLATGGTLADKLGDPAVKARLDRAIASAIAVESETELETDGSWRVTLAVPIEAVRQALTGPRALPADGDAKAPPPVVIVEGVTVKPAVGYTVGGLPAPTLWVAKVPAWAKDAPRVKATGAKAGAIDASAGPGSAATLFVIVGKS